MASRSRLNPLSFLGLVLAIVASYSPAHAQLSNGPQRQGPPLFQSTLGSVAPLEHRHRFRHKYDLDNVGSRKIGSGVNFYSRAQEMRLGNELSAQIDRQVTLLNDPATAIYLDRLVGRIAITSDVPMKYVIKVIKDSSVNAFALPGG